MYMLSTVISQTGECNAQHATDPCFLNQWGYSTHNNTETQSLREPQLI